VGFSWQASEQEWAEAAGKLSLTASDRETIKQVAYSTFREAFKDYNVSVVEGSGGQHSISMSYSYMTGANAGPQHLDNLGTFGSTTSASFSRVYIFAALTMAQQLGKGKAKEEILEGVGRGLGHTSAHEFVHQLMTNASHDDKVPHSDNPGDIMWGNDPGETKEVPAELFYGVQNWRQRDLNLINKKISKIK
jgi:hypothetical protein